MVSDRSIYLDAARAAVMSHDEWLKDEQIICLAADAAVKVDRERIAAQLRQRVLSNNEPTGLPDVLAMQLQDFLFRLADQIAEGMKMTLPSFADKDKPEQSF